MKQGDWFQTCFCFFKKLFMRKRGKLGRVTSSRSLFGFKKVLYEVKASVQYVT